MKDFPREDLAALVGLVLVAIGVFWIYRPASIILLGVAFLVYAFAIGSRNRLPSPAPAPPAPTAETRK